VRRTADSDFKQIKTPQTVLGVTKGREPGRPRRVWFRLVPRGENAPHHILVEGNPERQANLLRDPRTAQVGFRCFMSTTAAMTSWVGPLRPGSSCTWGENRCRYFRFVSALNSVEGFRTIAERISRPGRMRSAQTPTTKAISEAEIW
jgi:hypothetical protein